MKSNELALGLGGAAIGAGLTYFMVKRGGESGIPDAIRRQASRMEAFEVAGMTKLDIIGLMPFTHISGVKGGLYAACITSPGNENNPLAVMKVWISGTTAVFQCGQIADNDIWFCTVDDQHSATLSGKSVTITSPVV